MNNEERNMLLGILNKFEGLFDGIIGEQEKETTDIKLNPHY